jgi:hypothetical protein
MQNPNPPRLIQNLLILITVIGFALTGWLAGHILRHSIPALWHPPIEERIPGEKIGSVFEAYTPQILGSVPITNWSVDVTPLMMLNQCKSDVYYTSLPAKCQSVDGRLVQVGRQTVRLIPINEGKK